MLVTRRGVLIMPSLRYTGVSWRIHRLSEPSSVDPDCDCVDQALTSRPHKRSRPTVDDMGIQRTAKDILQPGLPQVRPGMERQVHVDV